MSIDIDEMVRMAKEREGWRTDGSSIANNGEFIAEACYRQDAPFIAQSPRAILTLSERVAELEAQNAALQARVEALGEWQSPDESPPLDYANDENVRFRFEAYQVAEALVQMPLIKQVRFMRHDRTQHTEWNTTNYQTRIPNEWVKGWRYRPDESPTAKE